MFISWIYAALKFYRLDYCDQFKPDAFNASPVAGTSPVLKKRHHQDHESNIHRDENPISG